MSSFVCPRSIQTRLRLCVFLGLLIGNAVYDAPSSAQSTTDNTINTLSPVGAPPHSSASGSNEEVSLATGALRIYLPVVSVPQRGGWVLPIGYFYNSNLNHPIHQLHVEDKISFQDSRDGIRYTNFTYTELWAGNGEEVLNPNLPRLRATIEYYKSERDVNDYQNLKPYNTIFCTTNWTFTDWQGSEHQFSLRTSCSTKQSSGQTQTAADAADGSFYHFDLSNPHDAVITAKDGTQYHFALKSDYFDNVPSGGSRSMLDNVENDVDTRHFSMTDPSGNQISVVEDPDATSGNSWIVTDTIGRSFSIGSSGVSYRDSNQALQQVTLSSSPGPDLATPLTFGGVACRYNGTEPVYGENSAHGAPARTSAATTLYTLSLPASDLSGTARAYKLRVDPAGHLLQIAYPSGGYTRYEYQLYSAGNSSGEALCTAEMYQVAAKYVCTSASGSCSSEEITRFQPTQLAYGSGSSDAPFNSAITETDSATGRSVTHKFAALNQYYATAPLETDVITADSGGKVLKTQHTDYTPLDYTQIAYPNTVTTTLNDSPNGSAQVTKMQYKNLFTISVGAGPPTLQAPLNTPTEIDNYDFSGNLLRQETTTYKQQSAFSVPHILDRIDTQNITDMVAGTTETTVMSYDRLGNVHSVSKSANDVVTNTITYGVYTNGYPASVTDGRSNQTVYGYDDRFVPGKCVPPTNSGAYKTSETLPDGEEITYQYNPCTGTLAASTDANGNVTSYRYDALGRQTSATKPNAFATTVQFSDAIPNTVMTSMRATPSPDVVSVSTLDGLARVVSSVKGDMEVDTTYDSLGRTYAVSNPKPAGASGRDDTVTSYDALDRVVKTTHPDHTSSSTDYFGEYSVLRDEVGSTRVITKNSQGLPVSVCEIAGAMKASGETPSACIGVPSLSGEGTLSGYTTAYQYSGSGALLNVTTHSQSRIFQNDSFGRLVAAQNPETGLICYGVLSQSGCSGGYDAVGNLIHKQQQFASGKSVRIDYNYDSLDRLVSKTFNDGTTLSSCFAYAPGSGSAIPNGNGRLSQEWTQAGPCTSSPTSSAVTLRTILGYDVAGRITQEQQCPFGPCVGTAGTVAYTYDLAGGITSSTNGIASSASPQIRATFDYDSSHRPRTVKNLDWEDAKHPGILFDGSANGSYGPFGLVGAQFGVTSTSNQSMMSLAQVFDGRGRVTSKTFSPGAGSTTSAPPSSTGPRVISITPDPAAAGVTPVATASCDEMCGTGAGQAYVDTAPVHGFTYYPGAQIQMELPNNLTPTTHTLSVVFTRSDGQTFPAPDRTFSVGSGSLPDPQMTVSIAGDPKPVPQGQSGEVDIALTACGSSCGQGVGDVFVDGNFTGGFEIDGDGEAVTYVPNTLSADTHTLDVYWRGSGVVGPSHKSYNFVVKNEDLGDGTITGWVDPASGILEGEYGWVHIHDACAQACGSGQYFIDGNFAGGFYLDDSGNDLVPIYPGQGRGPHTLTLTYFGSSDFNQSQSGPISFSVVPNNLIEPAIAVSYPTTPVPANQWTELIVTLTPPSSPANASCAGKGIVLVDGQYSDAFYVQDDNTVTGNNGPHPLLRPSSADTHNVTVSYFGNSSCKQTAPSFSFQAQ